MVTPPSPLLSRTYSPTLSLSMFIYVHVCGNHVNNPTVNLMVEGKRCPYVTICVEQIFDVSCADDSDLYLPYIQTWCRIQTASVSI